MGIESYSIMALPDGVSIGRNKEYWYLEGESKLLVNDIESELIALGVVRCRNHGWLLDDCLEIEIYETNAIFQGFEIKGCLSYLQSGIDLCYDFIKQIDNDKISLKLFILNQEIRISNSKQLYEVVKEMYKDKINIFQKQYDNIQLKATCGKFYKEIKKRNKWHYKFFHSSRL